MSSKLPTVERPLKEDEASEKWEGFKKRRLPRCSLKVAMAVITAICTAIIVVTVVVFFTHVDRYMDNGAKATEKKLQKQLFQYLETLFVSERNLTADRLMQIGREYEENLYTVIDNHTAEERNNTAAVLFELDQDLDDRLHKAIDVHTSNERNLTDQKLLELKQEIKNLIHQFINEHVAEERKVLASKLSVMRQDLEEPLARLKTQLGNSNQKQAALEQTSNQLRNQLNDLQQRIRSVEARKPAVHSYNSGQRSSAAHSVVLLAVCVSTLHHVF